MILTYFVLRIIKKDFLGTVFNFHFALYFLMKGLVLPLSIWSNIVLLHQSEKIDTEYYCTIMRLGAQFSVTHSAILTLANIIFR